MSKNGIALLLTLLFIIAMTASVGIGLKQMKNAQTSVVNDKFMTQSRMVVDDVLTILKNNSILDKIVHDKSVEELHTFLSQSKSLPLNISDLEIDIAVTSARSKFNINDLTDANSTINVKRVEILKEYMSRHNVNSNFVDMLLDNMGKVKEAMLYNSSIFDDNPTLFRDFIASLQHYNKIMQYYEQRYNDPSVEKIDAKELFSFSSKRDDSIDLNYATAEVWQMLLGVDGQTAQKLQNKEGSLTSFDDLGISKMQQQHLQNFNVSFFEPYLLVKIKIRQEKKEANVRFEYDIKNKKGYNFVYEI
ncbi:hypothetical protein [Sulfurimonas sp. HSL-1716]|uniref:hypothetical protein n=1 Tax=Hydrocurvibacter sulfurireducens TaxID=3131937 RepID=UPI0031F97504